jgi:hypothetical protein
VLLIGEDYPVDAVADAELHSGVPFLEIALVPQRGFDHLVKWFFAADRDGRPKGMVEVIL